MIFDDHLNKIYWIEVHLALKIANIYANLNDWLPQAQNFF